MTPETYIQRLLEVTEKKDGLLSKMLALTNDQTKTLTDEGIDDLQKLVDRKQTVIEAINKLDEDFDVYFQRFKSVMKINNLGELKNCDINGAAKLREAVAKTIDIIHKISEIENQNNEKAQALLGSLGGEIKKINQGKMVKTTYMPGPIKPPSYYFDKKK